ncbi:MAG TPA: hypothetical protein VNP95_06925 [Thermomicrobiales bacterium]|nr:hypothetical protein [Thermomicrobiales bacterium]
MTVLDPISGKQVVIDLSEKPRRSSRAVHSDEEVSPPGQEEPAACEPEPGSGIRLQDESVDQ